MARDSIVTYKDGDVNTGTARWTAKFREADKEMSKHVVVFEHCELFKVPKETPLESVRLEVLRKDAEVFSKTGLCAEGAVALTPSPGWNPIAYKLLCVVCAPRY